MRANQWFMVMLAGTALTLFGVWRLSAADPQINPNPQTPAVQNPGGPGAPQAHVAVPSKEQEKLGMTKSIPAKKLSGVNVESPSGEKLGEIEDVVIDLDSGKVAYAAVGVGGVLGLGEKLFAVPFGEFKLSHDKSNNLVLALDISKDRLEKAPGFDKNHWPDFAGQDWRNQVDSYYHRSAARPGERKE
jgi:sporulation protein YlmC with PRC-barrel domain